MSKTQQILDLAEKFEKLSSQNEKHTFQSIDQLLASATNFELIACDLIAFAKADPKAEVRNRGKVVFPAESASVKDNKDHFPINDASQARNALARANQFSSAPEWYKGTLEALVGAVARSVKKHYPSIDVSKAAKKPGKG